MTDLMKVMSEGTDFEAVFDRATESAEKFGQSISNTMDAYIEFAKQGFKEEELGFLADSAVIAGNVGDIETQKASEYMTASLIQWNMEAKESMRIIDSWNEVSNNFATTTQKLAAGQAKSASVAKAMGLEFDQLNGIIGVVTAATKQSGEEVGNFVKSVLPRLTSQPAQDAMKSLGVSLTDDKGNLKDIIQVYKEIAQRVQNISDSERIAVTEGLAGKYHIARMQAWLDDLASADSMYEKIYTASVNSAGSANEENERFMESLQARINLARVEVEKLALAFGGAFMTESIVSGLKIFNDFMSAITNFVNKFGALPALLGLVGGSIYLLSSRFKTFTASAVSGTASLLGFNGTAKMTSTWSNLASVSVSKLSVALRGLASATAVGLVFVGVGLALEKMISKMGEAREIQEKIAQENSELVSSYKNNKDTITELSNEYAILESKMKNSNADVGTQSRYYEVQNELAKLMPSLVSYEDSYGNSILISSSAVESKTKMLESQVLAEEKLLEIQKKREEAEKLAEAKKQVSDEFDITSTGTSKGNMNIALDRFNSQRKSAYDNYNYDKEVKNLQDMEKAIQTLEERKVKFAEEGQKTVVKNLDDQIAKLRETMNEYAYAESEYESYMSYVASATIKNTETVINESTKMSDEAKKVASNMMNDFVAIAGSSELATVIGNTFSNFSMQDVLSTASDEIKKFTSSTEKDFNENKKVFEDYAETLKKSILVNAKDSKGNSLKSDSKEYEQLEKAVEDYIDKLIVQETTTRKLMDTQGLTREEAENQLKSIEGLEEASGGLTEELAKQIEKLKELSSAQEQIVGVSETQTKAVQDSIFVIQTLGEVSELTAQQESSLSNSIELLVALYPHLTNLLKGNIEQRQQAIAIIDSENKANMALIEAYKLAANGKLSAEARATMGHLEETNKRIANINAEILALDALQQKYADLINSASNAKTHTGDDLINEKLSKQAYNKSALKLAELATLSGEQLNYANTLQSTVDAIKEQEKSSDKANKKTKESIYVTDKYKQALEALNLEIEKMQALQSKFPDYSEEYRKAVEAELKLQKDKLALFEQQSAELQSQIKSGKILQTGKVTNESSTTKNLSGWNGRITSGYNEKRTIDGVTDTHRGIDIAMAKGTRLDANIGGRVIASGNASSQGYHSSYGNIVVVQDNAGQKHIYAHLEKAIAKLGDTITAGTQIGTIGNTGRSYGSHLHYEVNVNGQTVDPSNYLNSARQGIVSVINGAQESIDGAISDLNGINSDIIDQMQTIANLEQKLIDSNLSSFDRRNEIIDADLNKQDARLANVNVNIEEYNKILEYQTLLLQKKQKANQEELAYINDLIANGGLSAIALADMKDRTVELTTEMYALDQQLQAMAFEKLDLYNEKREAPQDNIEFIKSQMAMMDDDTEEYADSLNKIILSLQEIQSYNQQELIDLENEIKSGKYTGEALENLQDRYEDLKVTIQNTNAEIRDTFYQAKQVTFNINDKAIKETQDKIDFLNYKISLLGEEDVMIKVDIYADIKKGLEESVAQIDKGITDAIIARNDAIANGWSTVDFDSKIDEYVQQRRSQLSEMQSIYNNMQSMVQDAYNKIGEAESNAYSEASKDIDKKINESEKRIQKFSDIISSLDEKMRLLQESNYDEKIGVTETQLSKTHQMASQIVSEYNRIASTPVYNEEQKQQVESQLRSLRDELGNANAQIIEYTKSLEDISFNKLISGANKSQKEIERLQGKLQSNLKLMEGGMLSGTKLDFEFYMPQGNVLDLSSLIENPIDSLQAEELSIQNIRSSSYGKQIAEAESFYNEMKRKSEEFYEVMIEQIEKFEKTLQLLMETADKSKKTEKDKSNDELLDSTQNMTKEELQALKSHYQSILTNMLSSMGEYRDEYGSMWDDIVSDLQKKISLIESTISNAKLETPSMNVDVPVTPSKNTSSGNKSSSPITKVFNGLKKVLGFKDGTNKNGVPYDMTAVVNEEGQELLIFPNGDIKLTSSSNAHVDKLVDLPKGTHVIPNKETNQILDNLPHYKDGTLKFTDIKGDVFKDWGDFKKYINAIKENTDALSQLSDEDRKSFDELTQFIDLYNKDGYREQKEVIKSSISEIKDSLSSSFKELDKYIKQREKEADKDGNDKPSDESTYSDEKDKYGNPIKSQWHKIKSGEDFSVGTPFPWHADFVQNMQSVERSFYSQVENGSTREARSAIDSALKVNELIKGYWTEEEVAYLTLLRKAIPQLLDTSNLEVLKDEGKIKTGSGFTTEDGREITSDENGALKFADKLIGDTLIKGDYLTSKEMKTFLEEFKASQFAMDSEGKYYHVGTSSYGRAVEQKAKQAEIDAINEKAIKDLDSITDVSDIQKKYNKISDDYTKQRTPKEEEIARLQQLLDVAEENGNTDEIDRLTKELLGKRKSLEQQDFDFMYENTIDLSKDSIEIANETIKKLQEALDVPNNQFTEETIAKYKQEIQNQKDIINSAIQAQKDAINQWFESQQSVWNENIQVFNDKIDDLQYELDMLDDDDTSNRLRLNKEILEQQQLHVAELEKQKKELQELLKAQDVGTYEWNLINGAIRDVNESLEDANLAMKNAKKEVENTTDDIIDTIKKGLEKQRDLEVAELEKRLDKLEKVYQSKLDAIGDRESERTFNNDRQDIQTEISDLEKQLNILSIDDSQEAIAKRLDLQKQLKEKREELAELEYQRGVELEKKAIEDSHERQKEAIDKEIEDVNWKYNEMLANERYFAQLREEILDGNLATANEKLKGFLDIFSAYNETTTRELGESFQELLNLIDEVTKASDNLKGINSQISDYAEYTNKPIAGTPAIVEKPRIDYPDSSQKSTNNNSNNYSRFPSHIEKILKDYKGNSLQIGNTSYNWKYAKENAEFMGRVLDELEKKREFTIFENGGTKYHKFNTGGFTGDSEGLAWLDKKEIVLNDMDTKNLLDIVKMTRNLIPQLPKIQLPSLPNLAMSGGSGDSIYNLTLNIDNLNGTQKDANNLASTIMQSLKKMGR